MKRIFLILLLLSGGLCAEQNTDKTSIFESIDPASKSSMTSPGFSAMSNNKGIEKDDDDLNVKMKTQSHMGDVLSNRLPVFGHNLFGSQCSQLHQARFFNPEYRITVGDEINVQMWGAYQLTEKLSVDTQGNIFIPEVGPVRVKGTENQKLNQTIRQFVKKTFKKGVNIYADLVTAQPVQVYVTGFVNSPGLYDGLSSDSVIHFLCAAGGINLEEGSFRDIKILRRGKQLHNIDLYSFLLRGNISTFQLHQGDTIVVRPQRYTLSVGGDVKNPYQYELMQEQISMRNLMQLINIEPTATYVRIQRNQGRKPSFLYLQLNKPETVYLKAGDNLTFVADKEIEQTIVTVKGRIKGPHQYVVKQGTSLSELVETIPYADDADIENLQLFRESVARQQKEAIKTNLSRLQRQTMTADSIDNEGAKLKMAQAEMVTKFVNEAKGIETKGQVVVDGPRQWKKIRLENNDTINIPPKTSVITISGDVINSISVTRNPNFSIAEYIKAAGGFQKSANKKEFLLMRQNGKVQVLKNNSWTNKHFSLKGGDQLIVLPKETESGIKVTGMMTSILYQLAIAARVAMRI